MKVWGLRSITVAKDYVFWFCDTFHENFWDKSKILKVKYDISFLNKTDLGVRKSRCLGRYNKTQCTFFPNCFVFETGSFYGALAVLELTDPPASASPHTTTTGYMFAFCYFWDTVLLSIAQTGLELSMCPSLTASASAEIASMRWHAQPNIMHFHYKALKQLNIAFKKALYIIYTCVRVCEFRCTARDKI